MPSTLILAEDGWLFSQAAPWSTRDFTNAAELRGFRISNARLAELYRAGILVPVFAVHDSPVGPPISLRNNPPNSAGGTWRRELDRARRVGCLSDPLHQPLPPHQRFDERKIADPDKWWNGLLYSRWQMLELSLLTNSFTMSGRPVLDGSGVMRLAVPDYSPGLGLRGSALLLAAVDTRYLPTINPGWLSLNNVTEGEWEEYRTSFDPHLIADAFAVTGSDVIRTAETLLSSAHQFDPAGTWHRLIRHADRSAQDHLRGLARLALDLRRASEILVRFGEDLGEAAPIPSGRWWSPLQDRIADRSESLDEALQSLGVSPHTRVVLIVEGESELYLVKRTLEHLQLAGYQDELQVIPMRGVRNRERMARLAAHLLTPTVIGTTGNHIETLRTLCQVIIATDPEGAMQDSTRFAQSVVDEVSRGLSDQDVTNVSRVALEELVTVITWPSEFEYSHFSDEEISQALLQLNLLGEKDAADALKLVASLRHDGKNLSSITKRLSKTRLAEQLWPAFRRHIEAALAGDSDMPELADATILAHHRAKASRMTRFVICTSD